MFGWEFPPHISGGLGTACYGLTRGLMEQGADVLFVVPRLFGDEDTNHFRLLSASEIGGGATIQQEISEGKLQVLQVNSGLRPYTAPSSYVVEQQSLTTNAQFKTEPNGQSAGLSGIYGQGLMEEVFKYAALAPEIASRYKFDLVHAHDWLTFPAGMAAASFAGKPLVVHVHATEFDRSGIQVDERVFEIEKKGMENANRVIAVSEYTKKIAIKQYGIPESKIDVVHNGVLPQQKKQGLNREEKHFPLVTFLGRVTFQKGPDYFLEAAYRVLKVNPAVRFVVAGHGDMMLPMIEKAAGLKIASRISFTGFIQEQEITQLFGKSDAYVMPSVSEPFGISALEAARAGVPAVISKQSGVAEVLTHALLVDFWDSDALADAILALLKHPRLSGTLAAKGQNQARRQTWSKAAGKVLQSYANVAP